ncbi:MAG: DNA translocase FtsK [Oscillospiraceae bacterium]|nr:DNA translocase FtsK [Oscillospiraceae bacterium]
MAQAKKSSTRKSTSTRKRTSAKATEAQRLRKNRVYSIVFSIVGILILCLTWISGESVWNILHNVMWGLFGISAVFVAPIIIYVACMLAIDTSSSAAVIKTVQGTVLIFLVSPMFEIINGFMSKTPAFSGDNFGTVIKALYENGVDNHKGGGALSIFIGGALSKLCGNVGALIVIILLVLLFVMLLTNITIVDMGRFIAGLFGKAKVALSESADEREAQRLEREAENAEKRKKEEAEAKEKEKQKKAAEPRIDVAKFLEDDEQEALKNLPVKKSNKKREKMPADFISDDDITIKASEEIFPAEEKPEEPKPEPVKEEPKKEETDAPAVVDTGVTEAEPENKLYVTESGQTALMEMENSSVSAYNAPPIDLLNPVQRTASPEDTAIESEKNSQTLVETLRSFGVATRIVGISRGPSVTRYELQPAAGVKVSKITSLADDIALNLAASGVRIEAPIPGKAAVGIEIANKQRETVYIRELIDSDEFRNAKGKLCFPVGRDIDGKIIIGDISKMPHILIAGTTGSGKSVFTNSIIMSILYNASPDEVKLILVDPKQVEFPVYNGIPHLLIPVVTDAKKAAGALSWAVTEMLKRYSIFAENSVRDLKDYNKLAEENENIKPIPQMVIVVDELADLMMAAPKDVEESICRLAQLARAAGMHLIVATQSPRVDIVTGLIKANIPSRVALKVSNQIDSRVILDEGGAEDLLGNGDLLYKPVGQSKPTRIQGGFVATNEIKRVVEYLKSQTAEQQYDEKIESEIEKHIPVPKGEKPAADGDESKGSGTDDMTERAIEVVVEAGQASTSFLQRRLKLGYARAARTMDELEAMGIVGPADGAKPRQVLMTKAQWLERRAMIRAGAGGQSASDDSDSE